MNLINEMLKDDLKVLWDNFLCCERFPKPEFLPHLSNKSLELTSAHQQEDMGYAYEDIFKWFAVGLDQSNHFPPSVHLQPVSVDGEFDGKILKRRALINTNFTEPERQYFFFSFF